MILPAQAGSKNSTLVQTDYGKIQGVLNEDAGVLVWKGVPYAKAPVGDLRWKAPQDPDPWDGVRETILPAKKCTQLYTTKEWMRTGVVDPDSSEDCLYVDIYRPNTPARLPVYVWIHGGSNNFGNARDYDGSVLASRSDVVVVIVQYRLGPIGWFYHPAVQTAGADLLTDSGNFGTLDHAQALKWVRENIAAFGGDPHNVIITGESAGGHNVMNMVVSPLGHGLFHKAMSESGGMYTKSTAYARNAANGYIENLIRYKALLETPPRIVSAAEAIAARQAMELGGSLEEFIRSATAGEFFLAILKYAGTLPTFDGIEDGTVLPIGGWMPAIKAGKYNKVPIILGSNEYESKSFMPLYGPTVKLYYGLPACTNPSGWLNLIGVLKGTISSIDAVLCTQADKDLYELTGKYGSMNWKAKYVDTVAHELARIQDDVYAYLFKWGGIGSGPAPFNFIYGAGHAAEIPFFFGGEQGLFGYPFVPANEGGRKDLQKVMMGYLARFARTDNPNAGASCHSRSKGAAHASCLPKWEKWSNEAGGPKAIVFDADLDQALIEMTHEEFTIEGVRAELEAAISTLPANAKAAARMFQFSPAW